MTKHIICYSGGHSSALVAIEVVGKEGKESCVLLNHNISSWVENADIKRFKKEVADYLGMGITYANIKGLPEDELPDQFDVVVAANAFKVGQGTELCTSRLKTEPFMKWLKENVPDQDCVIYYGFDANETTRIQRRVGILGSQGYKTGYPLAFNQEERTVFSTNEIGVLPPNTYENFKHANCVGCLKAGKQHWYVVYCTRKDIWEKAKWAEEEIGYSIIKGVYLVELEDMFEKMKQSGVPTTEHIIHQTFWKIARASVREYEKMMEKEEQDNKPCECVF